MSEPGRKTVLVIDDEEVVLETAAEIIEESGFCVVARGRAEGVMELIEAGEVDVVLTDNRMPDVTGLEMLSRIRSVNSSIPVILMTGYADLETAISALQEGAFDFILKPFNIEHLVHSVRRAVRHNELLTMERDYLRNLEEKVAERTMAIRQTLQELKETRDAAVEAYRVKSRFLATISHEIRTPIHGVLGMIELLSGAELAPQQREWVRMARQSVESLVAMLDAVLDYSRIEARRLNLGNEVFSLRRTVSDALEPLSVLIRDKGLAFKLSISPDVPDPLEGDEVRLRQIINNLAGNAVKFTDAGGIEVSVDLRGQVVNEVELLFTFRDTGTGIPADQIETIFDPFTQVDSSHTRRHGGSGLGLSIVRSLVGMMGGRIEVESTPGVGSTFYVTVVFPLGEQAGPVSTSGDTCVEGSVSRLQAGSSGLLSGEAPSTLLQKISVIKDALEQGLETLAESNLSRLQEEARGLEIDRLAEDILRVKLALRRGDAAEAAGLLEALAGGIGNQLEYGKDE